MLCTLSVNACGWFPQNSGNVWLYRIMPLDESRYGEYSTTWESDYMLHPTVDYSNENIRLWQQQTSTAIDLKDIEYVVYKADISFMENISNYVESNSFARWITANNRKDIVDLLIMAKQNEAISSYMTDPWYYRVEDDDNFQKLDSIVKECYKYRSGQLLGRYALQAMRALCHLRKYDECARYWDSIKKNVSNNVVRKMCELKAAAALNKTGRTDEALNIYAKYGDVASIRAINNGRIDNELLFVYDHCPNSPYLEGELQKWLLYFSGEYNHTAFTDGRTTWFDEEYMEKLLKVAHKAVKERKTKHYAMWYYTLAALYDVQGQPKQAKNYLCQGMKYRKSSFLRDSYRILRMWLDAQTLPCDSSYEAQLEADLRWLVAMVERNKTADFEKTMMKSKETLGHPLDDYRDYSYWNFYQDWSNSYYWNDALRRLLLRAVCPKMHRAGKYIREIQLANLAENLLIQVNEYSNEMFLIMDRLPYRVTRDYFTRIYYPVDDFDRFLNSKGKTDKNYWYDILATKCLRERRYAKALVYLKQIPVSFQQEMSVYSYMDKDPFSYQMDTYKHDSLLTPNYKLHFAEKMVEYDNTMRSRHDINKMSEAKIQYALGLRNSVHNCWFLTRHSSNTGNDMIRNALPEIPYPEDSTIYRHNEYIKLSEELINEAIAQYTDKEMAARQLRQFQRYQRILDNYGETATAKDIRQHCDKWRDYAFNTNKKSR